MPRVAHEMKMKMYFLDALVRAGRISMLGAALSLLFAAGLGAQDFGAQGRASNQAPQNIQSQVPKTPHAAAPKDLTGYWVSEVTELWRYRMIVPDKNDYQ